MASVRRFLRRIGAGTSPMWFLVSLAVTWIAITIVVGQSVGRTERIMAAGTGRVCGASACPPSMQIWPKDYVVFHPTFDTGFVVGFLVVAVAVLLWRWLGRLVHDDVHTR